VLCKQDYRQGGWERNEDGLLSNVVKKRGGCCHGFRKTISLNPSERCKCALAILAVLRQTQCAGRGTIPVKAKIRLFHSFRHISDYQTWFTTLNNGETNCHNHPLHATFFAKSHPCFCRSDAQRLDVFLQLHSISFAVH